MGQMNMDLQNLLKKMSVNERISYINRIPSVNEIHDPVIKPLSLNNVILLHPLLGHLCRDK